MKDTSRAAEDVFVENEAFQELKEDDLWSVPNPGYQVYLFPMPWWGEEDRENNILEKLKIWCWAYLNLWVLLILSVIIVITISYMHLYIPIMK